MNKLQLNRLDMYKAVRDFLAACDESIQKVLRFIELMLRLNEGIAGIEAGANFQVNGTKGKADARRLAHSRMLQLLTNVRGVLLSYATSVGNAELMAKAKAPKGLFLRMRYNEAIRIAEITYAEALVVADKLAPFWYGDNSLEAFRVAIAEASATVGTKKQSMVGRVASGKNLVKQFKAVDSLLENELDSFMEQYLCTNEQLAFAYANARRMQWLGIRRSKKGKGAASKGKGSTAASTGTSATPQTDSSANPKVDSSAAPMPASVTTSNENAGTSPQPGSAVTPDSDSIAHPSNNGGTGQKVNGATTVQNPNVVAGSGSDTAGTVQAPARS